MGSSSVCRQLHVIGPVVFAEGSLLQVVVSCVLVRSSSILSGPPFRIVLLAALLRIYVCRRSGVTREVRLRLRYQ